ncbi:MAG: hypothetical protein UHM85_05480 [Acutalibacteraceae bacterium]|nr:hypothetical protein [Acutalibacteraceae bacterium]
MKEKTKIILRCIIFGVICCVCLINTQSVLVSKIGQDYMKMHTVFEEPENSLDAVFLGSSASYAYWNPAVAWNEKGIAVYSMTNASQPVEISHYFIDDIRKRQPDALYIINITRMLEIEKYYNAKVHRFVNTYPLTGNKYKALDYMLDITNVPLKERWEYYFPIIRFHSRWKELKEFDLTFDTELYKSASKYSSYLKKSRAQLPVVYNFEHYEEITETMTNSLNTIMDYCKNEDVRVLFVMMPQPLQRELSNNRQNTVAKILEDNGFDVLDLRKKVNEIGIDYSRHYYDERHTNIHGSLLITEYISDYLIENYNFTDKRGTEAYASWDEDCAEYYEYISKHLWPEDYNILKSIKK